MKQTKNWLIVEKKQHFNHLYCSKQHENGIYSNNILWSWWHAVRYGRLESFCPLLLCHRSSLIEIFGWVLFSVSFDQRFGWTLLTCRNHRTRWKPKENRRFLLVRLQTKNGHFTSVRCYSKRQNLWTNPFRLSDQPFKASFRICRVQIVDSGELPTENRKCLACEMANVLQANVEPFECFVAKRVYCW